jgi:hypothetical protein
LMFLSRYSFPDITRISPLFKAAIASRSGKALLKDAFVWGSPRHSASHRNATH